MENGSGVVGVFVLLALLAFYFLPTIIASSRRHLNGTAIFVLNLLLGWTLLGWVLALVWSFTSATAPPPAPRGAAQQAPPPPPVKKEAAGAVTWSAVALGASVVFILGMSVWFANTKPKGSGTVTEAVAETAAVAAVKPAAAPAKPAKPGMSDKEKAATLAKMRKKHDKMEDVTWYYAKSSPSTLSSNVVMVYLGEKGGSVWPRFRVQYTGDDWLFFHRLLANCDGTRFDFTFEPKPETEVGYGGRVHEWVDVQLTKLHLGFVRFCAKSKDMTVRLEGKKFYRDRTVKAREKQAIMDALAAFEAKGGDLDGLPWGAP